MLKAIMNIKTLMPGCRMLVATVALLLSFSVMSLMVNSNLIAFILLILQVSIRLSISVSMAVKSLLINLIIVCFLMQIF